MFFANVHHSSQIAVISGLEEFAKQALEKCDARWVKHFDNDAALLAEV